MIKKKRGQDENPAPFFYPISYEKPINTILNIVPIFSKGNENFMGKKFPTNPRVNWGSVDYFPSSLL